MPENDNEPLSTTEKSANRRQLKNHYTTAEIDFIDQDPNAEGTKVNSKFNGSKSN